MTSDRDDGRYSRPFSGGDWNAYRQGQADRDRWDQARSNSTASKSGPDLNFARPGAVNSHSGDASGGSVGAARVLATLLFCFILTPLPVVIAAVATPILVALRRRKGAVLRYGEVFWPALVAAFVIFAVHAVLALLLSGNIGVATILGVEVASLLAAGAVLHRLGTHDSYKQAVIDAALAFVAPVALCIALISFIGFVAFD